MKRTGVAILAIAALILTAPAWSQMQTPVAAAQMKQQLDAEFARLKSQAAANAGKAKAKKANTKTAATPSLLDAARVAQRERARQLFKDALAAWKAGDFDAAEQGFRRGLDLEPANGLASYYYADCLQRRGARAESGTYMMLAVYLAPDTPEGQRARAVLKSEQNNVNAPAPPTTALASAAQLNLATLNPKVRDVVELARAAETTGRAKQSEARFAQTQSQNAAQQAMRAAQLAVTGAAGYGILTKKTNAGSDFRWEGQVAGNFEDGFGVYTLLSGSNKGGFGEGERRNGNFVNYDIFHKATGAVWEGVAGDGNGLGVQRYPSGSTSEGEHQNGIFSGYGVYVGVASSKMDFREFRGQFSGGQFSGYGVAYWKDGEVWAGEWKGTFLEGYGVKYDAQGHILEQGIFTRNDLTTPLSTN